MRRGSRVFTPKEIERDREALAREADTRQYRERGWSSRFSRAVVLRVPLAVAVFNPGIIISYYVNTGAMRRSEAEDRFGLQGLGPVCEIPMVYSQALIQTMLLTAFQYAIVEPGKATGVVGDVTRKPPAATRKTA